MKYKTLTISINIRFERQNSLFLPMRQFTQGKSCMHFKLSDLTEKSLNKGKRLTTALIKIDIFLTQFLWFPIFLRSTKP